TAPPPPPPSKNASGYCGCSSKTSSSAPRRSPSATASQSADPAPAAVSTNRTPIRRVTIARVIYCVGGVISPLMANIALSVLDDHFDQKWRQEMGTPYQRKKRRRRGQGN